MNSKAIDFKKRRDACIAAFKDPSIIDSVVRNRYEVHQVPYKSKTLTASCFQYICSDENRYVLPVADYMKEHLAKELTKKILEEIPVSIDVEESESIAPYKLVGRISISISVPPYSLWKTCILCRFVH